MSVKTWKKEFYPVAANSATATKTDLAAAKHSLRKWTGLTKSALKQHDAKNDSGTICEHDHYDYEALVINQYSCALCQRHIAKSDSCVLCPLYAVRNSVSCDSVGDHETMPPYQLFINRGDARPMVRWLKKTVEFIRSGQHAKYLKSLEGK